MNIDKNNITKPKQLIGGERRDKGSLQIFYQTSDTSYNQQTSYSTGLHGTYDLTLLDIKITSAAAAAQEYVVEMLSDTFQINNGNTNTNFKFVHRNGCPEIPSPVLFRQTEVRNNVSLGFQKLGSIQENINDSSYNVLLTMEYEKL